MGGKHPQEWGVPGHSRVAKSSGWTGKYGAAG